MSANVGSTDSGDQTPRVPCICGCGGLTCNRFCPGHDSTLYRELNRHIAVGTPGAAALFSFVYKNNDESTIDDQREAITGFFAEPEAAVADQLSMDLPHTNTLERWATILTTGLVVLGGFGGLTGLREGVKGLTGG